MFAKFFFVLATALFLYAVSVRSAGVGCNDVQDLTSFNQTHDSFHGLMQNCAKKCLGGASCTSSCIQSAAKLTKDCADCFGADAACSASKCMAQCMLDPASKACLQCVHDKCFPDLLTCSQVKEEVLPP
eukprot:TRINITY_DN8767_c0_g1_i1.p1 TRINITY_DN8767_c0_g1~~TRINITY_DN8767_c0_g1_i1.p1  ORF type:complete len:141 (-),score=21.70 TRINITY_DN8767_c0_g1_i1:202-588(-)